MARSPDWFLIAFPDTNRSTFYPVFLGFSALVASLNVFICPLVGFLRQNVTFF